MLCNEEGIVIKKEKLSASADVLQDFLKKNNNSGQNVLSKQSDKIQENITTSKLKIADGLKMRKVADQTVLLPVGKAVKTIHHTAVLNKEAARLVSLMTGEFTVEDIVRKGMEIYDVEEAVLRKDVEKIITVLKQVGMIFSNTAESKNGTNSISGTIFLPKKKIISDSGSI